ncbi:hypothetical protein PIB30_071448 [Stylosanthes scabra]|uniref:Uncharacterized protein n=1 Tax=Stylosanthes scabra TaxID=79078 RepID=A0ABU6XPK7_9FABA|nr:hypothetical protein [Stylosanthes scabra]
MEQGVEDSPKGFAGVPPDGSSDVELFEDTSRSSSEAAANVVDDKCADYTDVAGLTKEAIVRKWFRTEEGAYEFYKKFGKFHGFELKKINKELEEKELRKKGSRSRQDT